MSASLASIFATTRVAGLAKDRDDLLRFLDESVGSVQGVVSVTADVTLVERRRYWMDRDPQGGLGAFAPPALL